MGTAKIDKVLVAINGRALKAFTDEMSISLEKTTRSPILCEAKDFVTGLYDAEGLLHVTGVLAGNGAYEGLTFTVAGTVPAGRATLTYDGLIQPGSPPPGFPVAQFPGPASE